MKSLLSFFIVSIILLSTATESVARVESYSRAVNAYKNGQYAMAVQRFEEVTDHNHSMPNYLYYLYMPEDIQIKYAFSLFKSGKKKLAVKVFTFISRYGVNKIYKSYSHRFLKAFYGNKTLRVPLVRVKTAPKVITKPEKQSAQSQTNEVSENSKTQKASTDSDKKKTQPTSDTDPKASPAPQSDSGP